MNIRLLFYLTTFLLYNNLIYGQCGGCTNSEGIISNNGNNNFTTAIADQYFWEVCGGGPGTVVNGNNTLPTVSVSNPSGADYTIKVVRFDSGNCIEACKDVISDPCVTAVCPQSLNIGFFTDLGIDFCEGTVSLTLSSGQNACIDYVDWTVLGGSPTYIYNGSTSEEISLLLAGSINICAVVVYENRAACEEIGQIANNVLTKITPIQLKTQNKF